jgi:hypothetical protein
MSCWRRNRKRNYCSDVEDYKPNEEEYYKPDEEEDRKPVINIGSSSTTTPAPVPVSAVQVNVSLGNRRRGAFISSRGRLPGMLLLSGMKLLIFLTGNIKVWPQNIFLVNGIARSQGRKCQVLSGKPTETQKRKDS